MSDLDPEVRVKSVKAAAAIGDPRFMPVFHRLLDDPRWEVRCQAAKGLSCLGAPIRFPFSSGAPRCPLVGPFLCRHALSENGPGASRCCRTR